VPLEPPPADRPRAPLRAQMASCVIEDITDSQDEGAPGSAGPSAGGGGDSARGVARAPAAAGGDAAGPSGGDADADAPPPLSPPDDAEAVTPDRGVVKVVLAEGSGDAPLLHARCLGEDGPGPQLQRPAQTHPGPCAGRTPPAAAAAPAPPPSPRAPPPVPAHPSHFPRPAPRPSHLRCPARLPPPPGSPLYRLPSRQRRRVPRHPHGEREPGAGDPGRGPRCARWTAARGGGGGAPSARAGAPHALRCAGGLKLMPLLRPPPGCSRLEPAGRGAAAGAVENEAGRARAGVRDRLRVRLRQAGGRGGLGWSRVPFRL
jgi:hypothetical protein